MNITDRGVEFIANFEGFRSTPYWDVNHFSIGYGTSSHEGDGPITREEGLARLKHRIAVDYDPAVDRIELFENQNRHDALVSFVFNVGPGALDDRELGAALQRRDWRAAGDALLAYNRAGGEVLAGLTRRRQAERALFLRIAYTADERRYLDILKRPGPNPKAQAWLDEQARTIMRYARADNPDGWEKRDRGRRYQGIRRALNKHR